MKNGKVILLTMVMTVFATNAMAQFTNWSQLTSFNGGYASLVGEDTGNTLDGYAFDFTYEQSNMDGDWSGGVMITYLAGNDDDTENERRINYQSLPIMLQGKYFFGSDMIKVYLQGGAGLQFSRIAYTGKAITLEDADSGFAMILGLGANFFTGEKLFINAAYNFSYLSNSFYRDGIMHLLKVGIGFQSI